MSDAWAELRARLDRGEDVTLDEIVRLIATTPLPPDLGEAKVASSREAGKRPRGRPRKWTERDVRTIQNLCIRIRIWSEAETTTDDGRHCRPMSKAEIRERVGAALRHRMTGKSLENLFRRYRVSPFGLRIYRDEDFRRVLRDY